jgi:hypothetical protein
LRFAGKRCRSSVARASPCSRPASIGRRTGADLEELIAAGSLDRTRALGVLVTYRGGSDERVERLRTLGPPNHG